jgi:hypothetical protein
MCFVVEENLVDQNQMYLVVVRVDLLVVVVLEPVEELQDNYLK